MKLKYGKNCHIVPCIVEMEIKSFLMRSTSVVKNTLEFFQLGVVAKSNHS